MSEFGFPKSRARDKGSGGDIVCLEGDSASWHKKVGRLRQGRRMSPLEDGGWSIYLLVPSPIGWGLPPENVNFLATLERGPVTSVSLGAECGKMRSSGLKPDAGSRDKSKQRWCALSTSNVCSSLIPAQEVPDLFLHRSLFSYGILLCFLALWPLASYLTSVCISFFVSKIGIIILFPQKFTLNACDVLSTGSNPFIQYWVSVRYYCYY